MAIGIPKPVYPLALDSDYTLFKVKNSTQATLSNDLSEKSDIIEIVPQDPNAPELWPENGFVTIADELIYYDSVGKDENSKVNQLKDCIRGVEGNPEFYHTGTTLQANVVAQTHNQLVDAIMAIEDAIGDIGDVLKIGPQLKAQQTVRKNLLPQPKVQAMGAPDTTFAAPLNAALSSMVGCCPQVGDDACPDVEFEFNMMGNLAEYCIRIFGNYNSVQLDFGDGTIENTQLSGVHQYISAGPYNPTVTVCAPNCCIVQSPTPPNEFCCGINLPNPSVPFVVHIPDIPEFPQFIAPKQICPGPLLNLPPILMPEVNFCSFSPNPSCSPSFIVSVIEACRTPQVIQIVSPCKISILSLDGLNVPSVISVVGCNIPSVISFSTMSFDMVVDLSIEPICFCEPPSFSSIGFSEAPSFECISFCEAPSFDAISFATFPSIGRVSFDVAIDLSIEPVCFCEPPSFNLISFANLPSFDRVSFDVAINLSLEPICFCEPPSVCVSFCEPPSFECISFCEPPLVSFAPFPSIGNVNFGISLDLSVEPLCFCEPPSFGLISFANMPSFDSISFDVVVDLSMEPICFCEPPAISFAEFPSIQPVSFDVVVDLSMEPICFCEPPSFGLISFAQFPSIGDVNFGISLDLSMEPICFCEPPSFGLISFAPFPSTERVGVSVDVAIDLSIEPICFCEPPSLCISFCEPPSLCISFCEPPSLCISFCEPPMVSFAPFPSIGDVNFGISLDLSMEPICFCEPPSFGLISFANIPSFERMSFAVALDLSIEPICFCEPPSLCISFCEIPSTLCISLCTDNMPCISFCDPPVISFANIPSFERISFAVAIDLSIEPICFCEPPSLCISFCEIPQLTCISLCTSDLPCISFCTPPQFQCISFCPPPTISVDWGTPPVVMVSIICPSTTPTSFAMRNGFSVGPTMSPQDEPEDHSGIPINLSELLPSEIKLIVPKIKDIKVMHDIPQEIFLRGNLPEEIRILGPSQPIPDTITIRGDIPKSIELIHNLPTKIMLDATDVPRKILVEPAPNFPTVLRMEVIGMPQTLQVTGIPKTIEIIENIPRTIQLVMPEDPTIEMKYLGAPIELKPSPDWENLLNKLIVAQK